MKAAAEQMVLRPIGRVVSAYKNKSGLPHQGRGRDIRAIIELDPEYEPAFRDIEPGRLMWVLSWMHLAERDRLRLHPRGDPSRPLTGVFSLRSPARPNPVGLSLVEVAAVSGNRIEVIGLELLDGTPVVDLKPYVPEIDS